MIYCFLEPRNNRFLSGCLVKRPCFMNNWNNNFYSWMFSNLGFRVNMLNIRTPSPKKSKLCRCCDINTRPPPPQTRAPKPPLLIEAGKKIPFRNQSSLGWLFSHSFFLWQQFRIVSLCQFGRNKNDDIFWTPRTNLKNFTLHEWIFVHLSRRNKEIVLL